MREEKTPSNNLIRIKTTTKITATKIVKSNEPGKKPD